MRLSFSFLLCCFIAFTACRKSEEITTDKNVKLSFSKDTILFDTVFTAIGSANKRVKIYNTDPKGINISHVKLSGGTNSYFNLIINGEPVNEKSNLHIDGKDSISIFIKVTINPNNQNQPFIVQDSILFNTNGNKQSIPLIAYGQNAIFINGQVINTNTSWTNNLPYIIDKSVTIAPDVRLTIQPGTKVFFHGNSAMHIKGTLDAEGTKAYPIIFAGDRLESIYEEEPGQWNGIHFYSSSADSKLHYTIIKNAVIGITVDSLSVTAQPKLLLSNSIIKNMQVAGFTGYNADFTAFNNLFYNSGQYLIYGVGGGKYKLMQNTFAGINSNFPRRSPAVYFSDLYKSSAQNLTTELVNNIIWGTLTEEFLIEKKANTTITTDIGNNLIKTLLTTYNNNFNLLNIDPGFISAERGNFLLQPNSNARDKGANLNADPFFNDYLQKDLNNILRTFPSDLGCYQSN